MKLFYNFTAPAWRLYLWVLKILGYTKPLAANTGPQLLIYLAWILSAGIPMWLFDWDVMDYDNDAEQIRITIFGILWFLFGAYLVVGIYIHKLKRLYNNG